MKPDAERVSLDAVGPAIAAAVLGYYGFLVPLETIGSDGTPVPLWVAFIWALRACTALTTAALACAILRRTWCRPVYAGCELLSATTLLGILVWDLSVADDAYASPLILLVLIVLGVFNGASALRRV